MSWHYSATFHRIGTFVGFFRVRSRSENWRDDVASRMAVVEIQTGGAWQDFSTIREDDVAVVADAFDRSEVKL